MFTIASACILICVAVAVAYHGYLYLAIALSIGYVVGFVCGEISVLNLFKLL